MSLLNTKSTSPQIREAILKDPIRRVTKVADITSGHSLKDFYLTTLSRLLKFASAKSRTIEDKNLLLPVAKDDFPATLTLSQSDDDQFSCTLMTAGAFLKNVQVHAKENDFQGIPFNGETSTHFVVPDMQ